MAYESGFPQKNEPMSPTDQKSKQHRDWKEKKGGAGNFTKRRHDEGRVPKHNRVVVKKSDEGKETRTEITRYGFSGPDEYERENNKKIEHQEKVAAKRETQRQLEESESYSPEVQLKKYLHAEDDYDLDSYQYYATAKKAIENIPDDKIMSFISSISAIDNNKKAKLLAESGKGQFVFENHKDAFRGAFNGINQHDFAKELIDYGYIKILAENIKCFETNSLDIHIAGALVDAGYGKEVLDPDNSRLFYQVSMNDLRYAAEHGDAAMAEKVKQRLIDQLKEENIKTIKETPAGRGAIDPHTPPAALAQFARSKIPAVRRAVALNPNTPPEALKELAADEVWDIRLVVAKRRNTPIETLGELAKDKNWRVCIAVAERPDTPSDAFKKLFNHKNRRVRIVVAKNLNTPPEVLAEFKDDIFPICRAVAENPNTPTAVLRELSRRSPEVRSVALGNLKRRSHEPKQVADNEDYRAAA